MNDETIRSSSSSSVKTEASVSERQRMILRLVVREYVATGRPVSSKTLVEHSRIGVSSATIRNEMAALEELGYLEHCIPLVAGSDRSGYCYFVAHLMGDFELPSSEQLTILHQFRQVELQLEQYRARRATLARAAGNVSLVSAPIPQSPRLRHIELVSLQPRLGLVILVTTDGAVRQVMIHSPEDADQEALSPLADSLALSMRGITADDIPPGLRRNRAGAGGSGSDRIRVARHDHERRTGTAFRARARCSASQSSAMRRRRTNSSPCWAVDRFCARCCRAWKKDPASRSSSGTRIPPMSATPRCRRFDLRGRRRGRRRTRCGRPDADGLRPLDLSVRYMARLMSDLMADLRGYWLLGAGDRSQVVGSRMRTSATSDSRWMRRMHT